MPIGASGLARLSSSLATFEREGRITAMPSRAGAGDRCDMGHNFAIMRLALDDFPPLLFATLRFAFVLVPTAFFMPRTAIRWRTIAVYGSVLFAGEGGLMFYAMDGLISADLVSLVIQSQVFFTILFAVVLNGEWLRASETIALLLATAGMVLLVARADGQRTMQPVPKARPALGLGPRSSRPDVRDRRIRAAATPVQ